MFINIEPTKTKYYFLIFAIIVSISVLFPSSIAFANNYGESGSWRFRSPADRASEALVRDIIERKKARAYGPAHINNNTEINYNIDGDYVNCSVSAAATGNQGSSEIVAPSGSPTLNMDAAIDSDAQGNVADTATSSDGRRSPNMTSSDQVNRLSPVNSSASDNQQLMRIGASTGYGGSGDNRVVNEQTMTNSPQTVSVADSIACSGLSPSP